MENWTDSDLVRQARVGNKAAFGQLIKRYQGMALRVALGMVKTERLAEELVQEALLQAYLSLDHLQRSDRFRSWLYGIILNVCRNYLREQKINYFSWEAIQGGLRVEDFQWIEALPDPQHVSEVRELHHLVLEAIESLSPKNRIATLLFYYDQLSLQEIASLLDISLSAVKGRLYKARQQLRDQLLPVYLEFHPMNERRQQMTIQVTVADVIRQQFEREGMDEPEERYVVILLNEAGQRALPIWVGPWEGQSIAMGLRDVATMRPLTFAFVAKLLEAVRVVVEEIRVEILQEDTFYAVVKLRNGDHVEEVDARPSDAIALALRTASPIFVATAVMEEAGVDVSKQLATDPQLGTGLDEILREFEAKRTKCRTWRQKRVEKQTEKSHRFQDEVIAQVFGE